MRAEDWICPKCGEAMRKKDGILSCDSLQCPLRVAETVYTLPAAEKVGCRRYRIEGYEGIWAYAECRHKDALEKPPEQGIVIARVTLSGRDVARAFKVVSAPRITKRLAKFESAS